MSTAAPAPKHAPPPPGGPPGLRAPGYELFIIIATVMSLINWFVLILPFHIGPDIRGLMLFMEPFLTVVLLCDYFVRLHAAKGHRWHYMNKGGGWFDLLGSLPYGRILRLFRLWRVVDAFSVYGFRNVARWFINNRARGALFMVLSLLLLVLEVGGIVVLLFEEHAPGSNIHTGGEALWWGIVTISTVGYGNYYPVTVGGEITATIVIFSGVAIVGVFTAWAASTFLVAPKALKPMPVHHTALGRDTEKMIADLRSHIDALEAEIKRQREPPA